MKCPHCGSEMMWKATTDRGKESEESLYKCHRCGLLEWFRRDECLTK